MLSAEKDLDLRKEIRLCVEIVNMKYTNKEITEFLIESNAIERVFDDVSFEQAVLAWKYISKVKKMTAGHILEMHKILMLHQDLEKNEKGYFRTVPVWVGGREGLYSALIPAAVDQWVLNANDLVENGKKEPDVWKERMVKLHHVTYEEIHPFVDGNGRTGRLLMNWERRRLGLPICIIHADWPEIGGEQQSYYKWFRELKKT